MRVLAIDSGTTGTTAILFDAKGQRLARAYREFPQIYPRPGWVEHDPEAIWQSVVDTVTELCAAHPEPIAAVGITNQRETTILWDRNTGRPVYNAIVWQCRRTADRCRALQPHAELFRRRTGLPLDAYFSGTKIRWILDHAECPDPGALAFGTVDSWLIWKLTGGSVHATDFTNASRTLLLDIDSRRWDPELCERLGVPSAVLPALKASMDDYGRIETIPALRGVPILGVAGDQQAALFGQACFEAGQTKSTYGTGAFLLMHTEDKRVDSGHGLITTIAVHPDGRPAYAVEGSVFIAGAAIQWLRDELGLIASAAESEAAARAVPDCGGVYLVPAFVGLGAPHWDMDARGALVGLTRGTNRSHLIRATLESIAYQVADVIGAMRDDTGRPIPELAVDGGAVANDFLMQFQADILDVPVARPADIETTARGAAYLAGLRGGVWESTDALQGLNSVDRRFAPRMTKETQSTLLNGWRHALRQVRTA
jgi:glycerol kinase